MRKTALRDRLRANTRVLFDVALVVAGALIAVSRFWRPGVTSGNDMLIGIYRLFELSNSWNDGVLFPRLAIGMNFGYGGPLFEYYPPLVSYVALAFRFVGLGWIESSKAGFTLALFLAGLGGYLFARLLLSSRTAALVTAMSYMLSPYLLLDIYERGASAELMGLALVPWTFWAAQHQLCDRHVDGPERHQRGVAVERPAQVVPVRQPALGSGYGWALAAGGLVALLILAHNITALFVVPLLASYLVLLAWHEKEWARLPLAAAALALGLGLSAFYWLPALGEVSFSKLTAHMLGDASAELLKWDSLFHRNLVFDYYGWERYRLPLLPTLLAVPGVITIWLRARRARFPLAVFAALCAASIFLVTESSRPFWQGVPFVRFIQYPWRLNGITVFAAALLAGSVLAGRSVASRPWHRIAGWVAAMLLVGLAAYTGVSLADPTRSSLWYPISSADIGRSDLYARGRDEFPFYTDYTPAAVEKAVSALSRPRPTQIPPSPKLEVPPQLRMVTDSPHEMRLEVKAESPFMMYWPRIYFPRWQAYVAGQPVATAPSGRFGLAASQLPAGDYVTSLRFEDTTLRKLANGISAMALVLLVVGILRFTRRRKLAWVALMSLIVIASLVVAHSLAIRVARRPASFQANLQDEISLVGYRFDSVKLQPEEPLSVRLYWFAHVTPSSDYKVFVHLDRPDGSATLADADSEPSIGYSPTSRWDAGELVVDDHTIIPPPGLEPGIYQVTVGMYRTDPVRNLEVRDATRSLPGDRLLLGEIEVLAK